MLHLGPYQIFCSRHDKTTPHPNIMNTQTLQALFLALIFAAVAQADCTSNYNDCIAGGGGDYGCGLIEQLCEDGLY